MKKLLEGWRNYTGDAGILQEASYNRFKRMVDEERRPFLIISAYREGGNNQTANKSLKSDIKAAGYPFTQVVGLGQEELIDPKTGKPVVDPETGKDVVIEVLEATQIVTTHQRGDKEREPASVEEEEMRLFELGRALSTAYDQLAFVFGRPVSIVSTGGQREDSYFIAAYDGQSLSPEEKYRLKEDWAGPWTTIREATQDDVYWTKIAGTKGVFVENKIEELKSIKIKHRLHGAWRDKMIRKWKSLL